MPASRSVSCGRCSSDRISDPTRMIRLKLSTRPAMTASGRRSPPRRAGAPEACPAPGAWPSTRSRPGSRRPGGPGGRGGVSGRPGRRPGGFGCPGAHRLGGPGAGRRASRSASRSVRLACPRNEDDRQDRQHARRDSRQKPGRETHDDELDHAAAAPSSAIVRLPREPGRVPSPPLIRRRAGAGLVSGSLAGLRHVAGDLRVDPEVVQRARQDRHHDRGRLVAVRRRRTCNHGADQRR